MSAISLRQAGKVAVIPPRKIPRRFDRHKQRRVIENLFCKLKQLRAIATRYDKTAQNFLAGVYLTASIIWLKLRTRPS